MTENNAKGQPGTAQRRAAFELLKKVGYRQFHLDGLHHIGIWRDFDCTEVRAAIRTMHAPRTPMVIHLESDRVPDKYRRGRRPKINPGRAGLSDRTLTAH